MFNIGDTVYYVHLNYIADYAKIISIDKSGYVYLVEMKNKKNNLIKLTAYKTEIFKDENDYLTKKAKEIVPQLAKKISELNKEKEELQKELFKWTRYLEKENAKNLYGEM